MCTNTIINDQLMQKALTLGGFKSKREAVEEGLKLIILLNNQTNLRNYKGKLKWQGDLESMRLDS